MSGDRDLKKYWKADAGYNAIFLYTLRYDTVLLVLYKPSWPSFFQVLDHDEAISYLRAEVRQASMDARNLRSETRKLRHDQRQYLNRQLEACRAFEKTLKAQLKALSTDKKEEVV